MVQEQTLKTIDKVWRQWDKTTIDLFSLCDVLRNELTTYLDHINKHVMKDGSGIFYGCIQI